MVDAEVGKSRGLQLSVKNLARDEFFNYLHPTLNYFNKTLEELCKYMVLRQVMIFRVSLQTMYPV